MLIQDRGVGVGAPRWERASARSTQPWYLKTARLRPLGPSRLPGAHTDLGG